MANNDDLDDDIESLDDDSDINDIETAVEKLASMKRKWRDVEVMKELRMLERELGEKLDRTIFD